MGYVLASAFAARRALAVWRCADHAVGAGLWSAFIRRGVLTDFLMVRFFAARRMGAGSLRRKVVTHTLPLAFVLRLHLQNNRGVGGTSQAYRTHVIDWTRQGRRAGRRPLLTQSELCFLMLVRILLHKELALAPSVVLELVDEPGFDGVDAGGLDESWRQQPGAPVYTTDLDAKGVRRACRRSASLV